MKLGKTNYQILDKKVQWLLLFPEFKEELDMLLEVLKEPGKIKGELTCMPSNGQYCLTIEKDES